MEKNNVGTPFKIQGRETRVGGELQDYHKTTGPEGVLLKYNI
jgi:hypothetical protein